MNYDKRPRPSALPHVADCPRWASCPDGRVNKSLDEAADEGTLIHAKMEELASVPEPEWEAHIEADKETEPQQKELIKACATQVRDLFQFGLPTYRVGNNPLLGGACLVRNTNPGTDMHRVAEHPLTGEHYQLDDYRWCGDGIFAEVSVDPGVCQPGTADLVSVCGNRAVLVDYKCTFVMRTHDMQMEAYVIGLFKAVPSVNYVDVRIVTPRLGEVHETLTYERYGVGPNSLATIEARLGEVVERSLDPFAPGCPGDGCAMCAGNGRCPWQMASLRDVPSDIAELVVPGVWTAMLNAVTPEMRGARRRLKKVVDAWSEAVQEDDKIYGLTTIDTDMPGFTKSISAGRASLDKDRMLDANLALVQNFGLTAESLLAYCAPDKARLAEYVSMQEAKTKKEAEASIGAVLAPYMVRGADIVTWRAVKKEKAIKGGAKAALQ